MKVDKILFIFSALIIGGCIYFKGNTPVSDVNKFLLTIFLTALLMSAAIIVFWLGKYLWKGKI